MIPNRRLFPILCLSLGLAGCGGVLPDLRGGSAEGADKAAGAVEADIALRSDIAEPVDEAAPKRGFLAGFFERKDAPRAGLSQPKARPEGEAVGELVLTGGVVARAPAGYCVDASAASGPGISRRVAVMASCDRVSGKGQGADVPSAVLTVTVGRLHVLGTADVDAQALAAAFADQGPRAAKGGEDLVVVQLEKGGDLAVPGASPVHWRGVLHVGPRLVGLAVYVPKGSALVGARGGDLLRDLAASVRDASVIARRSEDLVADTDG